MPGLERDGVKELVIDAETHGNWTRFVNSSCRPNVLASPEQVGKVRIIAFRALRKLRGGEQLLISYGRQYFEERNIKCCCAVQKEPHLPPEEVVFSESEMELVESSESEKESENNEKSDGESRRQ
jgi:SET domain-containing protein